MSKIVNRFLTTLFLFFVFGLVYATHPNKTQRTKLVISGDDLSSNEDYSIVTNIERIDGKIRVNNLTIKIYRQSISIEKEFLDKMENPDLSNIRVSSDGNVVGSHFHVRNPFGDPGLCDEEKYLYISNLTALNEEGMEMKIIDPCK